MTDWQNRIVGMELVPVNQLLAHPHNARRHPVKQREALRGSLDSVGIVAPIIVNKRTNFIVDGHARVEEALTKNDEIEFPVIYIDVDENEEALILASFDFITYMAQYDADNLDALLQQVNTDNTAMQSLLSELAEDNGLYFGDEPALDGVPVDYNPEYAILIECTTEQQQSETLTRLIDQGIECRALVS